MMARKKTSAVVRRSGGKSGKKRAGKPVGSQRRGLLRRTLGLVTWRRLLGFLVLGLVGMAGIYYYFARGLPAVDRLRDFQHGGITEVYSDDGTLIAEFAKQQVRELKADEIPPMVKKVFVGSEDHRFHTHPGVDLMGVARAIYINIKNRGAETGASTITMQVARTYFLNRDKTMTRKIKESILAYRIERTLTKDEILALYLNQVYMGRGCYGLGAAAEYYFGKSVGELHLGEAAMLAALLPRPNVYNPISNYELARNQQRIVLRKLSSGEVPKGLRFSEAEAKKAYSMPIILYGEQGPKGEDAPYFTEHVRRLLVGRYGSERVYHEGLKVFTTVNLAHDRAAREALWKGVMGYDGFDRRQGFRVNKVEHLKGDEVGATVERLEKQHRRDWYKRAREAARDKGETFTGGDAPDPAPLVRDHIYKAVVTKVDDASGEARVLLGHSLGLITRKGLGWTDLKTYKTKSGKVRKVHFDKPSDILAPGDLVLVIVKGQVERDGAAYYACRLSQEPVIEGGLISMSTRNGHVKALVGGVDYSLSQFIRPVQAKRQPGSAMKPIVYAAALDDEQLAYSPSTMVIDTPIVLERGSKNRRCPSEVISKDYVPENYDKEFDGPMTVREALARSRNTVAVRTGWDLCESNVAEYAWRLGIRSELDKYPCLPLGCSEVTLEELAEAYNVFASGGFRMDPVYITRVYDRDGKLLEYEKPLTAEERQALEPPSGPGDGGGLVEEDLTDEVVTPPPARPGHYYFPDDPADPAALGEPGWEQYLVALVTAGGGVPEPEATPQGERVIGADTAFLVTDMLHSVVVEGTAKKAHYQLEGRTLAGKTGTTDNYKDALFVGYSPELLAAVWVGADDYAYSLGRGGSGSGAALPIWIDYMKAALADTPDRPFPEPEGIEWASICGATGKLANGVCPHARQEPFRKGRAPAEYCDCSAEPVPVHGPLEIERIFRE